MVQTPISIYILVKIEFQVKAISKNEFETITFSLILNIYDTLFLSSIPVFKLSTVFIYIFNSQMCPMDQCPDTINKYKLA